MTKLKVDFRNFPNAQKQTTSTGSRGCYGNSACYSTTLYCKPFIST